MAKKKEAEAAPDSVVVAAAKSIGSAAGTVAVAVGLATPPKPKVPKLVKKNKAKLPRRQKKAAAKAQKKTQ